MEISKSSVITRDFRAAARRSVPPSISRVHLHRRQKWVLIQVTGCATEGCAEEGKGGKIAGSKVER